MGGDEEGGEEVVGFDETGQGVERDLGDTGKGAASVGEGVD